MNMGRIERRFVPIVATCCFCDSEVNEVARWLPDLPYGRRISVEFSCCGSHPDEKIYETIQKMFVPRVPGYSL